ncbi:hypothetical protein FIBSPDRAFT_855812 [Athelia psychrophila]|uniref:Uncharacterized protein n=1 Tax=Athelia psychrophila TaxID=1759441 RepID=A0A166NQB0_9AGAM|nr:hypothetical protein FIBSPDRAFT_855812 [Fibularhizoctonia sp. CBS 109695]
MPGSSNTVVLKLRNTCWRILGLGCPDSWHTPTVSANSQVLKAHKLDSISEWRRGC